MRKRIFFLICLVFLFTTNAIWAKDINIVHFSDTHIDTKTQDKEVRKFAQTLPMFKRAVEKTNFINPDIVVFSGDMVNKPVESEFDVFLSVAKNINAPFYVALGNHDVGVWGGLSKETIIAKSNVFNNGIKIDKPYYFVQKDDYIFIFMDGTTDKFITAGGFFPRESLDFLDKTLQDNTDKKAIIIQHFPLMPPFKSYTHEVINKEEYFKILDKYSNVIMVLAGHYHYYSEVVRNNVLHITTSSMVQEPHAFREIKIFDRKNDIFIETRLHADELQNPKYDGYYKKIKLNK